jgi:hypothetical protein
MTMLERIQVVPAAEIHGRQEVPPELEGQWWQLERDRAVRTADLRESCRTVARLPRGR